MYNKKGNVLFQIKTQKERKLKMKKTIVMTFTMKTGEIFTGYIKRQGASYLILRTQKGDRVLLYSQIVW